MPRASHAFARRPSPSSAATRRASGADARHRASPPRRPATAQPSRHVAEASVVDNDARVRLAAVAVARQRLSGRRAPRSRPISRRTARADGAGEAQHGGPQRVDAGVRVARQLAPHRGGRRAANSTPPGRHRLGCSRAAGVERIATTAVPGGSSPRRAHARCAERERAAVDALRLVRNDQPARAVYSRRCARRCAAPPGLVGAQQPELVAEMRTVAQHVGVGVEQHRRVDVGGQVRQQLNFCMHHCRL